MIRLKKQTKFLVVILVIAISLFVAIKDSNIMDAFANRKQTSNDKTATKMFESAQYQKKLLLNYRVENFENINEVVQNLGEEIEIKYSKSNSGFKASILTVPDSEYANVLTKLKEAEGISNENLITAPEVEFSTNIEANVKNQKIAKKRIQELINKSTSPERMQLFTMQLEKIQTKIDSLENQITKQQTLAENRMIMIIAVSNLKNNTLVKSMKVFLKTTFISMIILTILLFIFYYFYVLMIKFMAMAGIKTARGGSSSNYNYNYNYNYNKRSYGRRIKRKYKDKDGKTAKEESDQKK